MICPMCGNQISDSAKFCPACGSAVTSAADFKGKEEFYAEDVTAGEEAYNKAAGDPEVIINGTAEKKTGSNGFAVAALIMSIVAVPCDYLLLIPSILAVIFGIIGVTKASSAGFGRGMSIAALIIGILAAILWVSIASIGIALLGAVISIMNF